MFYFRLKANENFSIFCLSVSSVCLHNLQIIVLWIYFAVFHFPKYTYTSKETKMVEISFFIISFHTPASLSKRNAQAYAIYEWLHEVLFKLSIKLYRLLCLCLLVSCVLLFRHYDKSCARFNSQFGEIMNPNFSFHLSGHIPPPPPPIAHHAMQSPPVPPAPAVSPSQSVPGR